MDTRGHKKHTFGKPNPSLLLALCWWWCFKEFYFLGLFLGWFPFPRFPGFLGGMFYNTEFGKLRKTSACRWLSWTNISKEFSTKRQGIQYLDLRNMCVKNLNRILCIFKKTPWTNPMHKMLNRIWIPFRYMFHQPLHIQHRCCMSKFLFYVMSICPSSALKVFREIHGTSIHIKTSCILRCEPPRWHFEVLQDPELKILHTCCHKCFLGEFFAHISLENFIGAIM